MLGAVLVWPIILVLLPNTRYPVIPVLCLPHLVGPTEWVATNATVLATRNASALSPLPDERTAAAVYDLARGCFHASAWYDPVTVDIHHAPVHRVALDVAAGFDFWALGVEHLRPALSPPYAAPIPGADGRDAVVLCPTGADSLSLWSRNAENDGRYSGPACAERPRYDQNPPACHAYSSERRSLAPGASLLALCVA